MVNVMIEIPFQPLRLSALQDIRQEKFTGLCKIKSSSKSIWQLYFYLGRCVYASGGNHPVRRWQRQVLKACPQMDPDKLKKIDLKGILASKPDNWDYEILGYWLDQEIATPTQLAEILQGILSEILFDVLQDSSVNLQLQPQMSFSRLQLPFSRLLLPLDVNVLFKQQQHEWQQWQSNHLESFLPNDALIIQDDDLLKRNVNPGIYQSLTRLIATSQTLRDLAIARQRPVFEITKSLAPYIKNGLLSLVKVDDLPPPPLPQVKQTVRKPLIACVDDSAWMCQILEKVIVGTGYRFLGIQDPLRAIPTLLSQKPDVILLDLRMPVSNGYEICGQLRQLSAFQSTPIIILTGNDGVVDRVRARLAGATDFLSKTIEHHDLLDVLNKYLKARMP
ncbi:MAG: response regulator [Synechococcaceae cyanobacterium SM2_3_2]|nr:response regulator [Synechococcaceae cyanobacterium SM2_3_2]